MPSQTSTNTATTDLNDNAQSWGTPSNANASDGVYTSISSLASSQTSNTLSAACTGFTLPATATVTGIVVSVLRKETFMGGNACDGALTIFGSGPTYPNNYADTSTAWPTTAATVNYGGAGDLWGASRAPTYAEINSAGITVHFSAQTLNGTSSNPQIDYFSVSVYYTTPTDPFPAGYQCQTRTNTILRM